MTAMDATVSNERRCAIARAGRALVRLSAAADAAEPAARQVAIVNDLRFTMRDAWDAVDALEDMVVSRGLITDAEIEQERAKPRTYLPVPDDAPAVTIADERTGRKWAGWLHEGVVHDASGFLSPDDLGWRYRVVTAEGQDITEQLQAEWGCEVGE